MKNFTEDPEDRKTSDFWLRWPQPGTYTSLLKTENYNTKSYRQRQGPDSEAGATDEICDSNSWRWQRTLSLTNVQISELR